jgi:hypothetical protein
VEVGEWRRAGLGIRCAAVLPQLTSATTLGAAAVAGYAQRQGIDVERFTENLGPVLTPESVGRNLAELAADPDRQGAFLLSGSGMRELG